MIYKREKDRHRQKQRQRDTERKRPQESGTKEREREMHRAKEKMARLGRWLVLSTVTVLIIRVYMVDTKPTCHTITQQLPLTGLAWARRE